jgi:excisionase family DNA binding protein
MPSDEFLTAQEVAVYLRIPPTTVYKLAREGTIPGFKIGRHWRFRRDAVLKWIEGKEQDIGKRHPP